jgi:hypothetical protein
MNTLEDVKLLLDIALIMATLSQVSPFVACGAATLSLMYLLSQKKK